MRMRRAIIIDDEPALANMLRRVLMRGMDFEVVDIAHDGPSAIPLLRAHGYELAIVDTIMPDTDPVALLDAVICHPSSPAILYYAPWRAEPLRRLAAGRAVEVCYPSPPSALLEAVRVAYGLRPEVEAPDCRRGGVGADE